MENQVMVMAISFLLLCRVGRSIVYSSKEVVVLQVMLLLVVLMGWKYTKVFLSSIRGMNTVLMKMNYSIMMLLVLGGTRFGGVEAMLVLIMIGRVMPIVVS